MSFASISRRAFCSGVSDGEWSGHKCIGCSLVMNPAGIPALRGPYGGDAAALLFVDIDLSSPARGDGCV